MFFQRIVNHGKMKLPEICADWCSSFDSFDLKGTTW
jgi:hypothetical protein